MRYSFIDINQFIKPLKKKKLRRGKGKIGNKYLEINLDALYLIISDERLDLSKIEGTYGGERFFFVCQECFSNARKLYKREGDYYKCGKCYGIYNQTLNRTKTDCTYYWSLAEKEIKKIDPTYHTKNNVLMPMDFPERPKYMRYDSYMKRRRKFMRYWQKGNALWLQGASRIGR